MLKSFQAVALITLLFLSSSALADKKTNKQAHAQFNIAVELFNEGKYDQAVIAFERAYELKPSFKILYNIAQTENELGHYATALEAYERYLEEGGERVPKRRRPEVIEEIERLRSLVGTISIHGAEPGVQVFVDDRLIGETPLGETPVFSIGDHEVLLKRAGDEIHKEIVRVAGGKESEVHYEVPIEDTAAPSPIPSTKVEEQESKRIWTWVALGLGGAAGITAGILGGVALGECNDIKDKCTDDKHCPASLADDRDKVKQMSLATDILYGVAAVGVAAGVALFFLEPRFSEKEETEVIAMPTITSRSIGVSLTGRF